LSEANIFGVAHDIDPSVGGEINYMVLGTSPSRQFVVNYTNVPLFSAACNDLTATSQIILYESSNVIDINIIDKPTCPTWNGGLAVVGIQNIDDTIAYTPTGRNMGTWDASNESWRFSPSVGTPNYVFEWYDGSTLVGTEETITVSPETTTTYTAAVTYNLCTGGTATITDDVLVTLDTSSDCSNLSLNNSEFFDLIIYPNPTASHWIVKASNEINSIRLFNLLGQEVLKKKPNQTEVFIDAMGLETGVYILQINNNIYKRLIKS
jgi:hypothetical protein